MSHPIFESSTPCAGCGYLEYCQHNRWSWDSPPCFADSPKHAEYTGIYGKAAWPPARGWVVLEKINAAGVPMYENTPRYEEI